MKGVPIQVFFGTTLQASTKSIRAKDGKPFILKFMPLGKFGVVPRSFHPPIKGLSSSDLLDLGLCTSAYDFIIVGIIPWPSLLG